MRKISEVLRLRFDLGLGQRAIASACSISQSTVHEYLNRAAAPRGWQPFSPEGKESRADGSNQEFVEKLNARDLPGKRRRGYQVRIRKIRKGHKKNTAPGGRSQRGRTKMAAKKAKKTTKRLKKGKKLEATKPLIKSQSLFNATCRGTHVDKVAIE